jgi:hypothetical protein
MTTPERAAVGKPNARARWTSWLFGPAILAAVALFVAHRTEERALARLGARAQPAWLLLGLLLQVGTYLAARLAATLLFRGSSYWVPMAPGILLARRETRT